MKKIIENRIGMYRTVIDVCEEMSTEMQNIPALWTNYNLFKAKVSELDAMVQLQMKKLKGITIDKNNSRENLIGYILQVAGSIKGYASGISDFEMYVMVSYTASRLRRMRDDAMFEAASIVFGVADANSVDLVDFGLTNTLFNDFVAAIDDYKEKGNETEKAKKMRKVYTKAVDDIDHLIRELLEQRIDSGIDVMGGSFPMFKKKYKSARVIYDRTGRRKESIELIVAENGVVMGVVTDGDGMPVEDAIVRIEGTTLKTYTDADGEYMIEVPSGTYNIVVWKEGFVEARDNDVDIGGGESVTIDLELVVAPASAA